MEIFHGYNLFFKCTCPVKIELILHTFAVKITCKRTVINRVSETTLVTNRYTNKLWQRKLHIMISTYIVQKYFRNKKDTSASSSNL